MRVPADSLILAFANLVAIGLVYLGGMTHISYFDFGSILNDLFALSSPLLLLATIVYAPRDIIRRQTRLQGFAAIALSIPCVLFLSRWEM